MTPDRCGTARALADLPEADRRIVADFRAFLAGDLDYDPATNEFVPPGCGVSRDRLYPKEGR